MENNLKAVVEFWGLWQKYKSRNGKWRELTMFFDKHKNFNDALREIKDFILNSKIDLFSKQIDSLTTKSDDEVSRVYELIRRKEIGVITYDQFKLYPSLKDIKNTYFLFYIGDPTILRNEKNEFASVVGSRKTPEKYSKWISDNVPKKIIVSGLANGADLMGHKWAINNNLDIVVFPGIDLAHPPKSGQKKEVWDYAVKKGIILSHVFPGSKEFHSSFFLMRNKWMAQMVSSTYVTYFKGISGTLGQVIEVAKLGGAVLMPLDVLEDNKEFLETNKNFGMIAKVAKCI